MHAHAHTHTPLSPLPLLRPRRLAARYEGEQQHWVKEQEGRGGEGKGGEGKRREREVIPNTLLLKAPIPTTHSGSMK